MLLIPIVVFVFSLTCAATISWHVLDDDTHRGMATFFSTIPLTTIIMLLIRRLQNPPPSPAERARDAWTQDAPQSSDLSSWRVLQGEAARTAPVARSEEEPAAGAD